MNIFGPLNLSQYAFNEIFQNIPSVRILFVKCVCVCVCVSVCVCVCVCV